MENSHSTVFGSLERSHFRLFGSENAKFYAELVEHLATQIFRYAVETVRKKQVQRAIEDFIVAREWQASLNGDKNLAEGAVHYAVYRHLVKSKWLEESKDGLRTIVDLNSEARLLLQALLDIKSGKVRSFGGEVLQVKTLVEAAIRDPETASENLTWASAHSERFMTNLRAIVGAMRKVEQQMKGQSSVTGMMNAFFHNYVTDNYIADYRKLRRENNPYRFRHELVERVRASMDNPVLVRLLSEAFVREGRAPTIGEAETIIIDAFFTISEVFSSIDSHIDMIDATNSRIERRILNINRFLTRMGDDQTGQFIDVTKRLGKSNLAPHHNLDVGYDLLETIPPSDATSLYKSRPPRKIPLPVIMKKKEKNPVLVAYEQAKRQYIDRAHVSPARVLAFLEDKMGRANTIKASEIEINTLDDFFVLERLNVVKALYPEQLKTIRLRKLATKISNEWILCPDFEIERIAEKVDFSR